MGTLTDRLRATGFPYVERQREHPTVVALCAGTLDEAIAREWLGQDYLFLIKERRSLARLAWQAPPSHVEDLFTKLVDVCTGDLAGHVQLCKLFDVDLSVAVMRGAVTAYTDWLIERAEVYEEGLIALWAGLWGYSTLGPMMDVPTESRFATWVRSYQDPGFATLAGRYTVMVDELDISPDRAEEVLVEGMRHEIAFWDPL
jgi:thiaminase/transcriptional activator TenA